MITEQKMNPIRVVNLDVEVKMNDNVETGHCPVSTKDTTRHKNLNTGVEMKPIEQKMKPIEVANPDVEVKIKLTDHFSPDIEVKMNANLHFDPIAEIKTVGYEGGMKPHGQNLVDGFCFDIVAAVKRFELFMNRNEIQPTSINLLIVYN